jgi:hypothetical protein
LRRSEFALTLRAMTESRRALECMAIETESGNSAQMATLWERHYDEWSHSRLTSDQEQMLEDAQRLLIEVGDLPRFDSRH